MRFEIILIVFFNVRFTCPSPLFVMPLNLSAETKIIISIKYYKYNKNLKYKMVFEYNFNRRTLKL